MTRDYTRIARIKSTLYAHQSRAVNSAVPSLLEHGGYALFHEMGCISGDMMISYQRGKNTRQLTLRELYKRFHSGRYVATIPTYVRALKVDRFGPHLCNDILYKGERDVIKVTTDSGKSVVCTPDHELLLESGEWIEASKLKRGNIIIANGRHIHSDGYVYLQGPAYNKHPRFTTSGVLEHVIIAEKMIGRPLKSNEQVHHINHIRHDNRVENLEVLTVSEHMKKHKMEKHFKTFVHRNGAEVVCEPCPEKIVSIKKAVKTDVYDIVMADPHRNFIANGIVVHNCGKTASSITIFTILQELKKARALVIIAPKAICSTWEEQLATHADIPYNFVQWDATSASTKKWQRAFGDMLEWQGRVPVFAVNVEAFQTKNKMLDECIKKLEAFDPLVIVDESSKIKSHDAARSKAIVALGRRVPYRMILTGTEITNSILDVYMQFEFLAPGFFGFKNFFLFRAYYAILEERYGAGGRTYKEVTGFRRIGELQDKIAPYTSRALKKDCLDLPPKIYQTIHVEMSGEQKRVYEELKAHLMSMVNDELVTIQQKMTLFGKFRQIVGGTLLTENGVQVIDANPPKLQALADELEDTDEQAIIWCAFRHDVDQVCTKLGKIAVTVPYFGDTSDGDREKGRKAFADGHARFFVATEAAAYGLNLQNCHLHYYYSRFLSPEANAQSEDRSHRIGQSAPCVYKSLVCKDTVDERIMEILGQKKDIRESFQSMTIADMIELV